MTPRRLVPLAGLLLVLAACGGHHSADFSGGTEISLPAPDVVAAKKHTDVPNCPKVGQGQTSGGMPSITLGCLGGGRPVDMAGLRGPMIVNLFAAWCTACHAEMPALAAYASHHSAVKVLGVDYLDQNPAGALALAGRSKVTYPLVADPKGSLDHATAALRVPGLPITVFIAADGKIAHVEAKAYTSEREVAGAVQQYLGTAG